MPSILTSMQQEVADCLLADPFFAAIPVLVEQPRDLSYELQSSVAAAGTYGVVLVPQAQVTAPTAPGPFFDPVEIAVRFYENVPISTGPHALEIAETALGALFYIEPTQTQDIDIFVHLNPAPDSILVSLSPTLDRLKELGFARWDEDKVVVEGWPVQFLPATKAVEMEAIEHAISQPLADGVEAMVPPPEYLMIIAIELGRPKDIIRLQQFHEEQAYDSEKLDALLKKHGLARKWEKDLALFRSNENS